MWWPNGYGEQPLYNFKVIYTSDHPSEDSVRTLRGGYRTIEFIEEPMDSQNLTKGKQEATMFIRF